MKMRLYWFIGLVILVCMAALPLLPQDAIFAQDDDSGEVTPPVEPAPPVMATPTPPPISLQIRTPTTRPPAIETVQADGLTLEVLFDRLPQGRVGVLRLHGDDLEGGRVRFRDQEATFFQRLYDENDEAFYALISASIDMTANRDYEVTILAQRTDGATTTMNTEVRVVLGGFIRQDDVIIPADRAYLIDPLLERTELARLFALFNRYTAEKLWDESGFIYPVNADTTAPFGSFRVFNGTTESRHTGWDLRVPTGTPVQAMASGRVAFAGLLDIRGNHVIIDHGHGIYSGYSHFSQIHVTRGQTVQRGQIIGVSGNTGRSSGPHLHWELAVNGEWVDSVDFLNMWMP